ncbi:MAG: tRNA-dihydrouridine synthase family protein [Chitinispirillaceae bacterium]|nr:tRNA-dihydrouridine synthase family protein [Chitinispirillaceae bacterium]
MTGASLQPFTLRNETVSIPLLSAPMAGISHSAYRRLLAHFGGYGALYTEMIPTGTIHAENLQRSPLTKRREEEGPVIYQLVVTGKTPVEKAVARIAELSPFALDLNLGCPAPIIARKGGGRALFNDVDRCRRVLESIRSVWSGPLIVKCRLGHERDGWEERFLERLSLFAACDVDALCVHPRFFHEKLKRRARHRLYPWIRQHWDRTLIANGDLTDLSALSLLDPGKCDGLMIGRAAVVKPWIFRVLRGETAIADFLEVWDLFYSYTLDDFPPERAIGRIKEFTAHYAGNFFYGHELFRTVQSAPDLTTLRERAHVFLSSAPQTMRT